VSAPDPPPPPPGPPRRAGDPRPAAPREPIRAGNELHVGPAPRPVYRLADACGVLWEHEDLDRLRRFLAKRNAWLVAQGYAPP